MNLNTPPSEEPPSLKPCDGIRNIESVSPNFNPGIDHCLCWNNKYNCDEFYDVDSEEVLKNVDYLSNENINLDYECEKRLGKFLKIVNNLDEFANQDCFPEDVLSEYLKYLEKCHPSVLFIAPKFFQKLTPSDSQSVIHLLDRKEAKEHEIVVFVLKAEVSYIVLAYEVKKAIMYHYYLPVNANSQLIDLVWPHLESYFGAEQLIPIESMTKHNDDVLFVIESILKLLKEVDEMSYEEMNFLIYPDVLKVNVLHVFLETKLEKAKKLLPKGFENVAKF